MRLPLPRSAVLRHFLRSTIKSLATSVKSVIRFFEMMSYGEDRMEGPCETVAALLGVEEGRGEGVVEFPS